ncbi:MAG: class I SAM-dependent methyltransferase [Firmicutes bacterium]|nr:class I SAM-dependent methyltransferase [Bacillota bacterium]
MAVYENYSNPWGLVGRYLISRMNKKHSAMAEWGFKQFTVPRTGRILDVGCGGGMNIRRLLLQSRKGYVYGADISPLCVERSRKANREDIGRRCEIYEASAEKLPFEDDFLDLVTAFETVYYWKPIDACFREIRRVLKEGGEFAVINDLGKPEDHWEEKIPNMVAYKAEEIRDIMQEAGFTDIRLTTSKNRYCVVGKA